jgi:hypothetical protein
VKYLTDAEAAKFREQLNRFCDVQGNARALSVEARVTDQMVCAYRAGRAKPSRRTMQRIVAAMRSGAVVGPNERRAVRWRAASMLATHSVRELVELGVNEAHFLAAIRDRIGRRAATSLLAQLDALQPRLVTEASR